MRQPFKLQQRYATEYTKNASSVAASSTPLFLGSTRLLRLDARAILTAQLLVACRQVYLEALPILYGQNVFYYDLEVMWSYHRPQAWRRCFRVDLEDLCACLKCQMYQDLKNEVDIPALDMVPQGDDVWNPNLKLVRRLQVTLVPYTYPEWRYRHRTAFPRQNFTCPHSIRYSMPQHLQVDLLVIRAAGRALMTRKECSDRQNWYCVASRYGSTDAQEWRSRSNRDKARDLQTLIAYARYHAHSIVLAGIGTKPYFESRPREGIPAYLRNFLGTGTFDMRCARDGEDDDEWAGLGTGTRMATTRAAQQQGDALVKVTGNELASIPIF
ncbi:hypothetical protein LTR12_017520 [Friedmanniomyces endolithicus]|nr:hypothetical protein LTR74_018555 [Friedmanniomyces endolithicus]KAK1808127.1 hypothetical protein LTR12_017520 [Friedmanniomyces endolithicus]